MFSLCFGLGEKGRGRRMGLRDRKLIVVNNRVSEGKEGRVGGDMFILFVR